MTSLLVKRGATRNKPYQARRGYTVPDTIPNKWNKEEPPFWWATNDIDSHLVVLDSVNFYLK